MEFDLIFETLTDIDARDTDLFMVVWNKLDDFASKTFSKLSDEDFMQLLRDMVNEEGFAEWAEQYRDGPMWNFPAMSLEKKFFEKVKNFAQVNR